MLDHYSCTCHDFNPQGSREPRRALGKNSSGQNQISIHKALASLDSRQYSQLLQNGYFNPQGSREPRRVPSLGGQRSNIISIHKALASLDGKNAQLFLHLCHIYMLHIIHLLQIVYQVEISSRNLIVFSGQLQCESPWDFMYNYYSHLVLLTKDQYPSNQPIVNPTVFKQAM